MEEHKISYNTGVLVKESKLSIATKTLYSDEGRRINNGYYPHRHHDDIPAPSQSILQKVLREDHNIHISVLHNSFTNRYRPEASTPTELDGTLDNLRYEYDTYEEALEEALYQSMRLILNNKSL